MRTPEMLANLTDWQIEHLYLKPAREQTERFRRETQPDAPAPAAPGWPVSSGGGVKFADRATVVNFLMQQQGMTREEAERDYELAARGTPRTE